MNDKKWQKLIRKFKPSDKDDVYKVIANTNSWVKLVNYAQPVSSYKNSFSRLQSDLDYKTQQYFSLNESFSLVESLDEKLFLNLMPFHKEGSFCLDTHISTKVDESVLGYLDTELSFAFDKGLFGQQIVSPLGDQLKNFKGLIEEYKECQSMEVLDDIYIQIQVFKLLAHKKLSKFNKEAKGLRRKIALYFCGRNLRSYYRHIIQFLFKNLDDESDSGLVTFYCNLINPQFLNKQNGIFKANNR